MHNNKTEIKSYFEMENETEKYFNWNETEIAWLVS